MILLGDYITSSNGNFNTLLKRTSNSTADGVQLSFAKGARVEFKPINNTLIVIQRLQMAFGVPAWSGNTSPSNFLIQYTLDDTAHLSDPNNSNNWITLRQWTSWSHKNGIVTYDFDSIVCRKIRFINIGTYQTDYFQAQVFRFYGEILEGNLLFKKNYFYGIFSNSINQLIKRKLRKIDYQTYSNYTIYMNKIDFSIFNKKNYIEEGNFTEHDSIIKEIKMNRKPLSIKF